MWLMRVAVVLTTSSWRGGGSHPLRPAVHPKLIAPAEKKLALGLVGRPGGRRLVGGGGLGVAAQAPQEVGADGVEYVVAVEVERVHQREGGAGAAELGHRHGAVECDDGARGERQQLVVERDDLAPVGVGRGRRVAVDGLDRRLDLVGAGLVALQAAAYERLALG